MKNLSRLGASAELLNHPDGYVVLRLQDHDGGVFGLQARADDNNVYLPSPGAPAYRLAVTGENPDVLRRFGTALINLARAQSKDGDDSADD